MFKFEFRIVTFAIITQLALKQTWAKMKCRCHIIICKWDTMPLLFAGGCHPLVHLSIDVAAVDAADVWLPVPAPTPLSTFAVAPRSFPPLMLLQSAFALAAPYHTLCNKANSSWNIALCVYLLAYKVTRKTKSKCLWLDRNLKKAIKKE